MVEASNPTPNHEALGPLMVMVASPGHAGATLVHGTPLAKVKVPHVASIVAFMVSERKSTVTLEPVTVAVHACGEHGPPVSFHAPASSGLPGSGAHVTVYGAALL
jgi:hypothetical protein